MCDETLTDKLIKMGLKVKKKKTDDENVSEKKCKSKKLIKKANVEEKAADTFKCPNCGSKVLTKTKYCVKCKKKVQPADGVNEQRNDNDNVIDDNVNNADTFKCPICGSKVLTKTKYCVKCKKKVQPANNGTDNSNMKLKRKNVEVK